MSVVGYVPLEFRNILIRPGRKLLGISIYLKDNRPENLAKLGKIFYERKVFPNHVYSSVEARGSARMVAILNLADIKDTDTNSFLKELESIDVVDHATIFKPTVEGLIVDTTSFPLTMFGERVFIVREPAFKEMILGILRTVGPQLTTRLLYQMGVAVGREYGDIFKRIARDLNVRDPASIVKDISMPILQSLSYAVLEADLDEDKIVVKKKGCIEYSAVERIIEENPSLDMRDYSPRCNAIRGMIEGSVSAILEEEFKSKENCMSESDYCEIILRPKWK